MFEGKETREVCNDLGGGEYKRIARDYFNILWESEQKKAAATEIKERSVIAPEGSVQDTPGWSCLWGIQAKPLSQKLHTVIWSLRQVKVKDAHLKARSK